MPTHPQAPESKHVRIEQMASGVCAAIHVDGGAAIGSAGIVDLSDRTLVYDSLLTPHAAEDLRAAAQALPDRPTVWLFAAFSPLPLNVRFRYQRRLERHNPA